MLERHPCMICGLNVLGIFYYYDDIRWAVNQRLTLNQLSLQCFGCRLTAWLNAEKDHYKRSKRSIMQLWLSGPDDQGERVFNTNNLSKALSDFKLREITGRARRMDICRVNTMLRQDEPLDRENDEVQVPLNDFELGRLGMKNRSPTVDSKDPIFDQWNWIDTSRKWAHGHGIPH